MRIDQHLKHWWAGKLRNRLWAANVAVLVAFLLLQGVLALGAGRFVMRSAVLRRNDDSTTQVAKQVSEYLDDLRTTLQLHALHLGLPQTELSHLAGVMRELRLLQPLTFRALYLFDDAGQLLAGVAGTTEQVQAASAEDLLALPAEPGQSAYYARDQANRLGAVYTSAVRISQADRLPLMNIALPVRQKDGAMSGVLVAEIDLRDLWRRLDVIRVGRTGRVYLATQDGVIIAHPDRAYVGATISGDLSAAIAGRQGHTEYRDVDGAARLASYSPVGGGAGWAVVVEQDASEVLAPLSVILALTGLLLAGALGVGTISVWQVAKSVTSPLGTLAETTRHIAHTGDLAQRLGIHGEDEVAHLAATFDQMLSTLQQTHDDLAATMRERALILASMSEALIFRDLQGRMLWGNDAAQRLLVGSEEERQAPCPAGPPPDASQCGACPVYLTLADGQSHEAEHAAPDGRVFAIRTHVVVDEHGERIGVLDMRRDVTERVRLEDELRQAQKMEAVGRLAGGVAHDFNNLLTVVNGYSEMILYGLPPDHALRPDITEIHRAGLRARDLTQQLLAFSRRQVLTMAPLALNDVIQGTARMLSRLIGEHIQLELDLAADLGMILADAGQMVQIVMNLAVNARDAMPQGGVLTIRTRNATVDAAYAASHPDVAPGPHVRLTVRDTGSGMSPEVLEHLFEPFFTTKDVGQGTGLGLAAVYGIVRQMGGSITVESELGAGATFHVLVPQQTVTPAELPALPGEPTERECILVVEHEADVRRLTARMLQRLGYHVIEAANAAAALDAARTQVIDLALADLSMPEMSGIELVRRLRQSQPTVKALYMSGYATGTSGETVTAPPEQVLQKPFDLQDLPGRVRAALESQAL